MATALVADVFCPLGVVAQRLVELRAAEAGLTLHISAVLSIAYNFSVFGLLDRWPLHLGLHLFWDPLLRRNLAAGRVDSLRLDELVDVHLYVKIIFHFHIGLP